MITGVWSKVKTHYFLHWITEWINMKFTELQRAASFKAKGEMNLAFRVSALKCALVIQEMEKGVHKNKRSGLEYTFGIYQYTDNT